MENTLWYNPLYNYNHSNCFHDDRAGRASPTSPDGHRHRLKSTFMTRY